MAYQNTISYIIGSLGEKIKDYFTANNDFSGSNIGSVMSRFKKQNYGNRNIRQKVLTLE